MTINEDYLWDRSGEPDPVVEKLEGVLSVYKHRPIDVEKAAPPPRRSRWWLPAAAAAAAAFVLVWAPWSRSDERPTEDPAPVEVADESPYEIRVESGEAVLDVGGSAPIQLAPGKRVHKLPVGSTLRAPAGSKVMLVADDDLDGFKRITLDDTDRSSVVRLDEASEDTHRLYLERGKISAFIGADVKPRLFQVGTPAGLAVDLGCKYDLIVDDDGRTSLDVTMGCVTFEVDGRAQWVPAGFRMSAPRGGRLSPPVNSDEASRPFREAVRRLIDGVETKVITKEQPNEEELLDDVLKTARLRDALTLYHLWLEQPLKDPRSELILDRVTDLETIPGPYTLDDLRRRVPTALQAYRMKITGGW